MHSKITYPADHQVGIKVPKGGSSCANCRFLQPGLRCSSEAFQKWNGSDKIPTKSADEYCSDLWEERTEKRSMGEALKEQRERK